MTAHAYVQDDGPWRRGIKLAISREQGNETYVRKFGPVDIERVEETNQPDDRVFLHLTDDEGRALYEALAKHYGYSPDSPTLLREDYLAERARVDKFIEHHVTKGKR